MELSILETTITVTYKYGLSKGAIIFSLYGTTKITEVINTDSYNEAVDSVCKTSFFENASSWNLQSNMRSVDIIGFSIG